MSVIEVRDLKKSYGKLKAVDGVSFVVERGQVFSLLGPNGAGKTTTVEILEGLRKRDGGHVRVLGEDPESFSASVKRRMAIVFQETALFENLTVWETLKFFKKSYGGDASLRRILEELGLSEKRKTLVRHLSGGQRRRLAIATILTHDPDLIFLDEPTTGLDPAARRRVWEIIAHLKNEGKTIFLTTHYMEEAQFLSDIVCIMNDGKIVEMGSPEEIISRSGLKSVVKAKIGKEEITLETGEPEKTVKDLIEKGAEEISIRKPNLEDVFLHLTGKELRG